MHGLFVIDRQNRAAASRKLQRMDVISAAVSLERPQTDKWASMKDRILEAAEYCDRCWIRSCG